MCSHQKKVWAINLKRIKKNLKNYFVKPNNHMTQIKHVIIVEALIT
jgi:hypothetical protein